jgi:hypothetical protein
VHVSQDRKFLGQDSNLGPVEYKVEMLDTKFDKSAIVESRVSWTKDWETGAGEMKEPATVQIGRDMATAFVTCLVSLLKVSFEWVLYTQPIFLWVFPKLAMVHYGQWMTQCIKSAAILVWHSVFKGCLCGETLDIEVKKGKFAPVLNEAPYHDNNKQAASSCNASVLYYRGGPMEYQLRHKLSWLRRSRLSSIPPSKCQDSTLY